MANIWFTSDTHFFHENILKFVDHTGVRIRPGYSSAEEMNRDMVERWNAVIKPQDKVWHLGDVAFKTVEKADELDLLLGMLNGHKRMIVGNHDNLKSMVLQRHFEKIELWKGFKTEGFTCSHIPLRLDSLRDGTVNVHGHIHQNLMSEPGYINVCVETRNYTPVHMDQLIAEVRQVQSPRASARH